MKPHEVLPLLASANQIREKTVDVLELSFLARYNMIIMH
jgi:hypothetical protein